jgi:hypothetical protein
MGHVPQKTGSGTLTHIQPSNSGYFYRISQFSGSSELTAQNFTDFFLKWCSVPKSTINKLAEVVFRGVGDPYSGP